MKKTMFRWLIALAFLLPCLVFSAAAEMYTSGYYTYYVSDGKATITDVDKFRSGGLTIPSTLGGYPVTRIGNYAFQYCSSLITVTIPDSVMSIGDCAFFGCASLTGVIIGNGVTSIGDQAFYLCHRLTSVDIPDSVTTIGDSAFYYCDGLTSVTIPDSVTSIGERAFNGCDSLITVFYSGTQSQWNSITIGNNNDSLKNATLIFETPIEVTSNPQNITVTPGKAANFSVTATGTGLTYQWQFKYTNGTEWKDTTATGNRTDTLTLPASWVKTSINGRQYRCKITDADGTVVYSDAATLTVKAKVAVTGWTKGVTTMPGVATHFVVTAKGEGLTYQWQLKYPGASRWTNTTATGNKTDTLTLPASWVKVGISGRQYRCKVTDSFGNVAYSGAATLTVE